MEVAGALGIVAVATAIILNLGRFAERAPLAVSRLHYINVQSTYQVLLLGVALLVLSALHGLDDANLRAFLGPGDPAAPANGVAWLGIADDDSWLGLGTGLSCAITLATLTFVYAQFRTSAGRAEDLVPFLPWILAVSFTNSFSEEVVYRLGVVVPLAGAVDTAYILVISAVAFGAPHLRGMPNGIVGAAMAGALGWLLAKSVVETHGIFWAWLIHWLQDIVIFSALTMAAARRSRDPVRV
jgi:membrane protease YdiL (CAAX protease family)